MNNNMLKLLMIAGGIFAVCFGLFIVATRFYEGITERQDQLSQLELEEASLMARLAKLEKSKKEVDKWKTIAMPGNVNASALMYKNFLQEMMLKHRFVFKSFSEPNRVTAGNSRQAAPLTAAIPYDVIFEANLQQLSAFLQEFYSVNVPHVIKSIIIEPLGKGNEAKLNVTMKVEVLSMSNVPPRQSVIANPMIGVGQLEVISGMSRLPTGILFGLTQLTPFGLFGQAKLATLHKPEREYATMLKKNVFAGLAPAVVVNASTTPPVKQPDRDILKYTQLTSITANYISEEGLLRIRKTNKYVKLRPDGGVNEFEIRDGDNVLVLKGKVLAIKPREIAFEYDGKAYVLYVGQFMEEALKKPISTQELKEKYDAELTAIDQQ